MVRPVLFLVVLLSSGLCADAQRFAIEAHGTYQLPIGGSTQIKEDWQDINDTTRVGEIQRVNVNWGTGLGSGLGFSMGLSDRLQVGLRATYFPGSRTEWRNTFRGGESERSVTSRFVRLEPAVRLRAGEGKFSWHIAVGPSIVLAPQSVTRRFSRFNIFGYDEVSEFEWKDEGGVGYGGFAGVGLVYAPFRNWNFFGEVTATAQSWSPRRTEVTRHEQNGVDMLPAYSTYSRETEYVDSYRTDDADNPDEPMKALRFHYPMSSWGIRVGVCYTFHRRGAAVEHDDELQ